MAGPSKLGPGSVAGSEGWHTYPRSEAMRGYRQCGSPQAGEGWKHSGGISPSLRQPGVRRSWRSSGTGDRGHPGGRARVAAQNCGGIDGPRDQDTARRAVGGGECEGVDGEG